MQVVNALVLAGASSARFKNGCQPEYASMLPLTSAVTPSAGGMLSTLSLEMSQPKTGLPAAVQYSATGAGGDRSRRAFCVDQSTARGGWARDDLVANPRRPRLIYENDNKSDGVDAEPGWSARPRTRPFVDALSMHPDVRNRYPGKHFAKMLNEFFEGWLPRLPRADPFTVFVAGIWPPPTCSGFSSA